MRARQERFLGRRVVGQRVRGTLTEAPVLHEQSPWDAREQPSPCRFAAAHGLLKRVDISQRWTRRSIAHMDQMDEKGWVSEFHDCLVHEPISIKVAMKIAEARRSRRSRMKQSSIACGTCETSPDVHWKSCAPGGQRQRRRWIQGRIRRTRCISFTVGSGKGFWIHHWYGRRRTRSSIGAHSSAYVGSSGIAEVNRETMTTSMDTNTTQPKTPNIGIRLKNHWFLLKSPIPSSSGRSALGTVFTSIANLKKAWP